MSKGTIKKVAGPLVIAQGMRDANTNHLMNYDKYVLLLFEFP